MCAMIMGETAVLREGVGSRRSDFWCVQITGTQYWGISFLWRATYFNVRIRKEKRRWDGETRLQFLGLQSKKAKPPKSASMQQTHNV
jgi:hypothetical protein